MEISKKQKALELKRQGLSYQQIADEIGVSKTTAFYWVTSPKGNPTEDATSELLSGEDDLKEVKRELSKIRNQIAEVLNSNESLPELVELRRLELEHEYRMEELENSRQENLSTAMVKELQTQIEQLKNSFDQSKQELDELAEQNSDLQSEADSLLELNSRLHDKIAGLERKSDDDVPEGVEGVFIPENFIDQLKSLFNEYIGFDDTACDIESIESLNDQLTALDSEIEDWSKENNYDYEDAEILSCINKFLDDIEESISNLNDEDEDKFVLEFNHNWIADMQACLDDL